MTTKQFEQLEEKAIALGAAFEAMDRALIDAVASADDKDKLFILEALRRLSDRDITTLPYWWHPQTEWTGGDSSDAKNFKVNPPHIYKALAQ